VFCVTTQKPKAEPAYKAGSFSSCSFTKEILMHVREDNGTGDIKPIAGARWTIGAPIGNEWIGLIERTPAKATEIKKVMGALNISEKDIDTYFPKNKKGERCPTFELVKIFDRLRPRKKSGGIGV
jgi:hypothetical protein